MNVLRASFSGIQLADLVAGKKPQGSLNLTVMSSSLYYCHTLAVYLVLQAAADTSTSAQNSSVCGSQIMQWTFVSIL